MVALLKMPRFTPALTSDDAAVAVAERRTFTRKPVNYTVDGTRLDHTLSARRNPYLSLSLRDLSIGGLAATSDVPLLRGERLAVSFPARGLNPGWDSVGRVLRCDPTPLGGYRVALEFDSLPAA